MTISELTREALDAHLAGPPDRPLLRAMAGSFNSGGENLASRVDEIIAADIEAGRFP